MYERARLRRVMSRASTQSQSWSVLPDGVVVYGILFLLIFSGFYEKGRGTY